MECRTSLKVREFVLARLTGEPAGEAAAAVAAHVAVLRHLRARWPRRWRPSGAASATTTPPTSAVTPGLRGPTRRRRSRDAARRATNVRRVPDPATPGLRS